MTPRSEFLISAFPWRRHDCDTGVRLVGSEDWAESAGADLMENPEWSEGVGGRGAGSVRHFGRVFARQAKAQVIFRQQHLARALQARPVRWLSCARHASSR